MKARGILLMFFLAFNASAGEELRELLKDFDDLFAPVSQRQIYVSTAFVDGTKSNTVFLEGGLGLVKLKDGRVFGVSAREAAGNLLDVRIVEFVISGEDGNFDTLRLHARQSIYPGKRVEIVPGLLALAASYGN